MSDPASKRSVG